MAEHRAGGVIICSTSFGAAQGRLSATSRPRASTTCKGVVAAALRVAVEGMLLMMAQDSWVGGAIRRRKQQSLTARKE